MQSTEDLRPGAVSDECACFPVVLLITPYNLACVLPIYRLSRRITNITMTMKNSQIEILTAIASLSSKILRMR